MCWLDESKEREREKQSIKSYANAIFLWAAFFRPFCCCTCTRTPILQNMQIIFSFILSFRMNTMDFRSFLFTFSFLIDECFKTRDIFFFCSVHISLFVSIEHLMNQRVLYIYVRFFIHHSHWMFQTRVVRPKPTWWNEQKRRREYDHKIDWIINLPHEKNQSILSYIDIVSFTKVNMALVCTAVHSVYRTTKKTAVQCSSTRI